MLQKIRWFLLLSGLLLVVIVAFQNQDPVDLSVLFFSGRYPLTLLLLATSAISFVLGSLMTAWKIRARGKSAKTAGTDQVSTSATPPTSAKTASGGLGKRATDGDKTPLEE